MKGKVYNSTGRSHYLGESPQPGAGKRVLTMGVTSTIFRVENTRE
jgi:hypothetical protein